MEEKIELNKSLLYSAIGNAIMQSADDHVKEAEKFFAISHPIEGMVHLELGVAMRDVAIEYAKKAIDNFKEENS